MLGNDHPGLFEVGNEQQLAELMWRAESDASFYQQLLMAGDALAARFAPAAERQALAELLEF